MDYEIHALTPEGMVLVVGVSEGRAVIPDFPPFDPDNFEWAFGVTPCPNQGRNDVPTEAGTQPVGE